MLDGCVYGQGVVIGYTRRIQIFEEFTCLSRTNEIIEGTTRKKDVV